MKVILQLFLTTLFFTSAYAQDVKRIEVSGKVSVNSNEKEGITVFNTSSNKGTTTNENGEFKIEVAINDVVEFGALQFKDFSVTITDEVIKTKKLVVVLVEDINKLDEVLILPYDLSGNLQVDIESVKTFNPNMDAIYFGIANVNDYEFSDDIRSRTENTAMHSQGQVMQNGLNVINLVGLLISPLLKSKNKKDKTEAKTTYEIPEDIQNRYSKEFIHSNFKIPLDQVEAFIAYIENSGFNYDLMAPGKEMELLEFINKKSKLYLKTESGKN